ncbi:hypothetical protein LXL04_010919 [Taraxacum kok-saghyz]
MVSCQSKHQKIHVDEACDQGYKLDKSGGKLGFKVINLDADGVFVAEIKRKQMVAKVDLGDDVFTLRRELEGRCHSFISGQSLSSGDGLSRRHSTGDAISAATSQGLLQQARQGKDIVRAQRHGEDNQEMEWEMKVMHKNLEDGKRAGVHGSYT